MNGVPGASRVNSVVQNPMVYSEEKAAVHICIVRCFAGESKEGTVSTMSSANRKSCAHRLLDVVGTHVGRAFSLDTRCSRFRGLGVLCRCLFEGTMCNTRVRPMFLMSTYVRMYSVEKSAL